LNRIFDEIQVFDGIAERTGQSMDRASVRGHSGVCRSLSELYAKSRRLGDGFYYLAASEWPAEMQTVKLTREWAAMA
jgi:hypothetical protein